MSGIIQGKNDINAVEVPTDKYHIVVDLDGKLKKKSFDGSIVDLETGAAYTSVEKVFECNINYDFDAGFTATNLTSLMEHKNSHIGASFSHYQNMLWTLFGGNFDDGGSALFEGMTFSSYDELAAEIQSVAEGVTNTTVLICYYLIDGSLPKVSFQGRNSTYWRLKGGDNYYGNTDFKTLKSITPTGQTLSSVASFVTAVQAQSEFPNYTMETLWITNGRNLYVNESKVSSDHPFKGMYELGGPSRSTMNLAQTVATPLSTFQGECTPTNYWKLFALDRFGSGNPTVELNLSFRGRVYVRKYSVNSSYFAMVRPCGIDTLLIDYIDIPVGYKLYAVYTNSNNVTKKVKEITSADLKTRPIEEVRDFEGGGQGNSQYSTGRLGSIFLEEFMTTDLISRNNTRAVTERKALRVHLVYGKDGVFSNYSDSYLTFNQESYKGVGYFMVNKIK
jgi:hypothetical protein